MLSTVLFVLATLTVLGMVGVGVVMLWDANRHPSGPGGLACIGFLMVMCWYGLPAVAACLFIACGALALGY